MSAPPAELTFICPDCLRRARRVTEIYHGPTGVTAWLCTCPSGHMWDVRRVPPIPREDT